MPDELRLEARHPWFKFFPADWVGDERLALCTYAERGLLVELLCIMHRSTRYGRLLVNGTKPSDAELTRLTRGNSVTETRRLLAKLLAKGVLSSDHGIVFSRRMVRYHERAKKGRENGKLGGNPLLKGLTPPGDSAGAEVNPRGNTHMPDARSQKVLREDQRTSTENKPAPQSGAGPLAWKAR